MCRRSPCNRRCGRGDAAGRRRENLLRARSRSLNDLALSIDAGDRRRALRAVNRALTAQLDLDLGTRRSRDAQGRRPGSWLGEIGRVVTVTGRVRASGPARTVDADGPARWLVKVALPSGGAVEAALERRRGFTGEQVTLTGVVSAFRRTEQGERVTVIAEASIATGER